jgi:sugar lactone lactonase YvrE
VFAYAYRHGGLVAFGGEGGRASIQVDGEIATVDVAAPFATGLHQVDNPVFDPDGNLYVTYSGTRGQQVPVSIFRVRPNGTREAFCTGLVNPTSMAFGPDGRLYVSSRFEGTVYRVDQEGRAESFATDLGIPCGLAFDPEGRLLVGDRSGTIFRVDPGGQATMVASVPSSVAAFHLALGPDGALYVTAPTLSPYDSVFRVDRDGAVTIRYTGFGRPQGITFGPGGELFVVEALAGASGVYRLPQMGAPELVLAGPGLVGLAFGADSVIVCSNETAYRLPRRSM